MQGVRRTRDALWLALAVLLLATPAVAAKPGPPDVPKDAVLASVPMLSSKETNRIFVDLARPGERPFRLMIDTGSAYSHLTPRYARELGVIVRRTQERPYERSTLLGRNLQFYVDTRESDTASRTGWEYGFLGGHFLSDYVLDLDFAARRVSFLDPKRFAVPESVSVSDEAVLPLKVVGNRPFLEIQVDGKPLRVLLVTGMPIPMALSGRSARAAGLADLPVLAKLHLYGVFGNFPSQLAEAKTVGIGPFRFSPAPVVLAPEGNFNQEGATGSFLGYEMLAPFHVRIDYPHRRLWLKRVADQPPTCFGVPWAAARRAGIVVWSTRDAIRISAVLPASPAARLGLRPGDWLAIPSAPTRAEGVSDLIARIEKGEPISVGRRENGALTPVALGGKQPAPKSP